MFRSIREGQSCNVPECFRMCKPISRCPCAQWPPGATAAAVDSPGGPSRSADPADLQILQIQQICRSCRSSRSADPADLQIQQIRQIWQIPADPGRSGRSGQIRQIRQIQARIGRLSWLTYSVFPLGSTWVRDTTALLIGLDIRIFFRKFQINEINLPKLINNVFWSHICVNPMQKSAVQQLQILNKNSK